MSKDEDALELLIEGGKYPLGGGGLLKCCNSEGSKQAAPPGAISS
jgi:hypothetical protein